MAVPWGLVLFLVGLAYGFFARGKQSKGDLFRRGLLIGLVLALVFLLLGFFAGRPALGVGGFFAILWGAFVLTLLFILGVWLGDLLEPRSRSRRA